MEYEFRLMPTKRTTWTRKHNCETSEQAMTEARGMMYALYFQYKHPRVEIWQDGRMIAKIG